MTRRLFALVREDDGAELLEFALSSVVFFTVVFGVMSFGLAIWQYNVVASGAKDGARWAAVRASSASDADVQTYVRSRAFGLNPTVTTSWPSKSAGSTVVVTVQKSFSPVSSLVPQTTLTLRSAATMIIIR